MAKKRRKRLFVKASQKQRPKPRVPHRHLLEGFILPLLEIVVPGEGKNHTDYGLSLIFNNATRGVWFAKAKVPFEMPGNKVQKADKSAKGGGVPIRRSIKAGDPLVIRVDTSGKASYCEIESDETIFTLTRAQWRALKSRVELIY